MEMKLVKVAKPKTEYMTYIENQIKDFKSHVHRMKTLYEQIKVVKDQLIPHHANIHTDFAENNSCKLIRQLEPASCYLTSNKLPFTQEHRKSNTSTSKLCYNF